MREFVVVGHDAPTTPTFSLDDLPGDAGRLDVLCRCVTSAFLLSHGIREDVRVHLVLGDEFTITFSGGELRRLNPDERSTAALIRTALANRDDAVGAVAVESSPGVSITRRDFAGLLQSLARDGTVIQLAADGDPAIARAPPSDPVFVLSDHRPFTDAECDTLAGVTADRLSLSPRMLHADQAITIAHHYLDTDGYKRG